MTIRYTITRPDLVRAHLRGLLRQPILLIVSAVMLISFVGSTLSAPEVRDGGWLVMSLVGVVATATFFVFLLGFSLLITVVMIGTRKNTGVLGEHTLTITDTGLLERTAFNESLHRWQGLHKIISTRACLIIHVTDTMFHYVSKKRPLLEGNIEDFENALTKQLTAFNPPASAR